MRLRYRPGFIELNSGPVPDGYRGCDAIITITMVRRPDGSLAYEIFSQDGESNLSDDDLFLAFAALADILRARLTGWRQQVVQATHELFHYLLNGGELPTD